MEILGYIIALFEIGILVCVHELGHLIMAKIGGIGVDAFSIGFGKELIGFTKGETRYRISIIPFGGYCKMRGEETKDREALKTEKDGENESEKTETIPDPKAMYNRPPLARLGAVMGGSLFNYLFAILIMSVLFIVGFDETLITSQVSVVEQSEDGKPSPAYLAGLQSGDTILSIGNKNIESFVDIPKVVAMNIDKELPITYARDGQTNVSKITPLYNQQSGLGFIGVAPYYNTVIGGIKTNSPAAAIGLNPKDKIVRIHNTEIAYFYQIEDVIRDLAKSNIVIITLRETNIEETVREIWMTNSVTLDIFEGKGYLGVYPAEAPTFVKHYGAKFFFDGFALGFLKANSFIAETLEGLGEMIRGKIDVQRNISGPVRIIQVMGVVTSKTDLVTILKLMALISAALGFFNLLPIPGFDGGHVVFNLVELITRRKIPEKVLSIIEYVGLFFIIGLSLLVFMNDIVNIFMGR